MASNPITMQFDSQVQSPANKSVPQGPTQNATTQYQHSFDEATQVERLSSPPLSLDGAASNKPSDSTVWYRVNIRSEWCSTPQVPHGGFLASLMLSALLERQSSEPHPDPCTLTYDFLKVLSSGEAFIGVTNLGRVSGNYTSVHADLSQSRKGKVVQGVIVRGSFANLSKQRGVSVLPLHYGPSLKLEDLRVPHPRSWYLPPDQAMISRHTDMLIKLETQRRPFTDYFLRFHPDDIDTPQQEDFSEDLASSPAPSDDYWCKGSRILPLRSAHSRRIDFKSLPMFGDLRRPAYENVIKKDATHLHDVPTRQWAFPTLQYTIRFLSKLPKDTEWISAQWRETIIDGRIVSDVLICTEKDAQPVAICQLDSLMFDMAWTLSSLKSAPKPAQQPEPSQL